MPYRALTHGRVNTPSNTKPSTHQQEAAINSQKGVANNGSVISQRNRLNKSNQIPRRSYARTLKSGMLMGRNALGAASTYVSNQGKGFPNATPQVSVGSTNVFSRRAINRRAVTKRVGEDSENCCETKK